MENIEKQELDTLKCVLECKSCMLKDLTQTKVGEIMCSNLMQIEIARISGIKLSEFIDLFADKFRIIWESGERNIDNIISRLYI